MRLAVGAAEDRPGNGTAGAGRPAAARIARIRRARLGCVACCSCAIAQRRGSFAVSWSFTSPLTTASGLPLSSTARRSLGSSCARITRPREVSVTRTTSGQATVEHPAPLRGHALGDREHQRGGSRSTAIVPHCHRTSSERVNSSRCETSCASTAVRSSSSRHSSSVSLKRTCEPRSDGSAIAFATRAPCGPARHRPGRE